LFGYDPQLFEKFVLGMSQNVEYVWKTAGQIANYGQEEASMSVITYLRKLI